MCPCLPTVSLLSPCLTRTPTPTRFPRAPDSRCSLTDPDRARLLRPPSPLAGPGHLRPELASQGAVPDALPAASNPATGDVLATSCIAARDKGVGAAAALLRSAPSFFSRGGIVGPWAAQVRRSLLATPPRAAVANGAVKMMESKVKKRNKKGAGGGGLPAAIDLEIREAEEYLATDVQEPTPDDFPFEIVDEEGMSVVILKKDYKDEKIEVIVSMPNMDAEPEFDEDVDSVLSLRNVEPVYGFASGDPLRFKRAIGHQQMFMDTTTTNTRLQVTNHDDDEKMFMEIAALRREGDSAQEPGDCHRHHGRQGPAGEAAQEAPPPCQRGAARQGKGQAAGGQQQGRLQQGRQQDCVRWCKTVFVDGNKTVFVDGKQSKEKAFWVVDLL